MGIRSMLGILDGLGALLGGIFDWVMNTVLTPILQLVIKAVFNIIKYFLAHAFYLVSTFILQLLDFVEVLFRALAGLDNSSDGTIFFSVGGKEGDLLVQMLTTDIVINAFLSCCIVGLFLLLITTIFQMIKVEYTSEGAQNSKTSIIGKSLKSFANLLLIPVLVIFGVVIGNAVLDLIDTATGGGQGNKISGVLWVAAGSNAILNETGKEYISIKGGIIGLSITSIEYGLKMVFTSEEDALVQQRELFGNPSEELRKDVENGFSQCLPSYQYSKLEDVVEHYNIFEVNYLVLIFGACLVLKALALTCFGLVDRLYQCLALFIVSPFVIGMSPVKDSLASWRTKFIQKALSAYGIVISLNLFFIIVKVFLSMDVIITLPPESVLAFSTTLMEGLIKSIFVIVGANMIEKLAGDLGQYFGAGNATAEGKGIAAEATKGLASAAKVGMGVAGGAAGLAMKLGKGVASSGLAKNLGKGAKFVGGKLGGVASGIGKKFAGSKIGGKTIAGAKKVGKFGSKVGKGLGKGLGWADKNIGFGIGKFMPNSKAARAEHKEALNEANDELLSASTALGAAQDIMTSDRTELSQRNDYKAYQEAVARGDKGQMDAIRRKYSKPDGTLKTNSMGKYLQASDNFNSAQKNVKSAQDAVDADSNRILTGSNWRQNVRDNVMTNYNAFRRMGSDGLKSLIPGPVSQFGKDWNDAKEKGNSVSAEGQAALDRIKKRASDAAEKAYNQNIINNTLISQTQKTQSQLIAKAVIQKAEFATNDLNKSLEKYANKFNEIADKLASGGYGSPEDVEYAKNEQKQILEAMQSLRGGQTVTVEGGKIVETNYKIDLNIDAFKNSIEAALKKNATTDQINEIIANQLKAAGLSGNETLLKELKKAVEEVKNSIGGK